MSHGLRTTGIHTGNFGRAKVQGKRESLDLSKQILNKENLKVPQRNEAFTKLVEAYNKTPDPKMKAALWEILKRRKATLQQPQVKQNERPTSDFWEMVRNVR
jgi:hypothetical protein